MARYSKKRKDEIAHLEAVRFFARDEALYTNFEKRCEAINEPDKKAKNKLAAYAFCNVCPTRVCPIPEMREWIITFFSGYDKSHFEDTPFYKIIFDMGELEKLTFPNLYSLFLVVESTFKLDEIDNKYERVIEYDVIATERVLGNFNMSDLWFSLNRSENSKLRHLDKEIPLSSKQRLLAEEGKLKDYDFEPLLYSCFALHHGTRYKKRL